MGRYTNLLDLVLGAIVLSIVAVIVYFAIGAAQFGSSSTFDVTATFNNVGGLKVGSDVKLSGVKIGKVTEIKLDPRTYQANVTLMIDKEIKIPDDSGVRFATSSVLSDPYLEIEPGGSEENLENGDKVIYAQGYVDLINLIQGFVTTQNESGSGISF